MGNVILGILHAVVTQRAFMRLQIYIFDIAEIIEFKDVWIHYIQNIKQVYQH